MYLDFLYIFGKHQIVFYVWIRSPLGKGKMLAAILRGAPDISSEEGRLLTSGSSCPWVCRHVKDLFSEDKYAALNIHH